MRAVLLAGLLLGCSHDASGTRDMATGGDDLAGADLAGVDFSGVDFAGVDLTVRRLPELRRRLSGWRLRGRRVPAGDAADEPGGAVRRGRRRHLRLLDQLHRV